LSADPSAAGASYSCGNSTSGKQLYVQAAVGIEYLADSPNYNWVKTTVDNFGSVANVFKYNSSVNSPVGFGRIQINNFTSMVKVSKVVKYSINYQSIPF
jgi:hypothetical protein